MNENSVGRTVEWARKRAGMTQHDLAGKVRMPQPSIARIERGSVLPRTATLIAILRATGHELHVEPVEHEVDLEPIRQRLALAVPTRTSRALGKKAKDRRTSPTHILTRLRRFNVPFVLIGELAEAAHGALAKVEPTVEVVHAQTDVARERIGMALEDLGGAETRAGRLVLLTETAAGDDYDVLARTAVKMHVDTGILVPVASIEDLVRVRRARGDLEAAAVLRAVRDEVAARKR